MPTQADLLIREASRLSSALGHTMTPFIPLAAGYYYSGCENCGATVYINVNPMPDENKIGIHGEAVEKKCSYPKEGRR
jgi:hypothetical protein